MTPERTLVALLASGLSTRFRGDKLMAHLDGQPLLAHAAGLLRHMHVQRRLAVVPEGKMGRRDLLSGAGWDVTINPQPETGLSSSLRIAAQEASTQQAEGFLVLLADMPFVTETILEALWTEIGSADVCICSDGSRRSPPVLFARSTFDEIADLKGDEGARPLLSRINSLRTVAVPETALFDIDTEDDLDRATALLRREPRPSRQND